MLDACHNVGWKMLIALCRLAGLRRSEALRLLWLDINLGETSFYRNCRKNRSTQSGTNRTQIISIASWCIRQSRRGSGANLPYFSAWIVAKFLDLSQAGWSGEVERCFQSSAKKLWDWLGTEIPPVCSISMDWSWHSGVCPSLSSSSSGALQESCPHKRGWNWHKLYEGTRTKKMGLRNFWEEK